MSLIIVNRDAFDLTPEQTAGIRNNPHLWNYFREEAEYGATRGEGVEHGDIVAAVLNAGTIWVEDGKFHLADFDGYRWHYVWNGNEWKFVEKA